MHTSAMVFDCIYLAKISVLRDKSSRTKEIRHDLKTDSETHGLIGAIYCKPAIYWLIGKSCCLRQNTEKWLKTNYSILDLPRALCLLVLEK